MKKKKNILFILIVTFLVVFLITSNKENPKSKNDVKEWYYDNKSQYHLSTEEDKVNNSQKVIIAVIDSGINIKNPYISKYIWRNKEENEDGIDEDNNGYVDDVNGWNFINNNKNIVSKKNNHGTYIAYIISTNIEKISKNASSNIKLMPLKVLNSYGQCKNNKSIIKAIKYAEKQGAKICNISFGTEYYSKELKATIQKSNMLFVVSAGNGKSIGRNIDKKNIYPACYECDNIITVGNANKIGKANATSNFGTKSVDVFAPGTDIVCIDADGKYEYKTGTSFATPFVSSVAAIQLSHNNKMSIKSLKKKVLLQTIKKENMLGFDNGGVLLK